MPTHHQPKPPDERGLKIIHASFFRMGTNSMATAYQMLGYKVHHGLLEKMFDSPWAELERAAEATYPSILQDPPSSSSSSSSRPRPRPRPRHTRKDWDELWGNTYDVATDLSCPFTFELLAAYPDAKVVVVQRDFDQWWPSFASQMRDTAMPMPQAAIASWALWNLMGCRAGYAVQKMLKGMFDVRGAPELDEKRARLVYDEYFARVRREVPPERRLEFNLATDGWAPLCEFLGRPVPGDGVDFPFLNTRASHDALVAGRKGVIYNALAALGVGVLVLGGILVAWSMR
ncbi:uncharacterized protein B0I36DRAFT_97866 [Microdochium trichocladiopsis]|uniref:P-loop containing nucleoside triphosphate hydrolase protein n=1 Tax=Microdochium trichocladiopsis TaxID=1682393 RepID=A0A9P8YDI1_9PEZI|nr:uncharacterized protein B0I36DRAFT_97866 [Microdochium trichocladiopsis]KAH7035915.1 hypothetical protein B0I36DRAFT_97866 [Microdochium trichocladiopsis]